MKILITGSDGFIAKNIIIELKNRNYNQLFMCNVETTREELEHFVEESDAIIHLAGVNRPQKEEDFFEGNTTFTETIISLMKKHEKKRTFIFSSSIQASLENSYGKSKKAAEELLKEYSLESELNLKIYRLPNVFGKWCRPNYNSVVATFCHNIANDLEIHINDASAELNLVYIDDVVDAFIQTLETQDKQRGIYVEVESKYRTTVGKLAETIYAFKQSRDNIQVPNIEDTFQKKLYSTYLSYLDTKEFLYPLKMNVDTRGSFTEFLRSDITGQVSINITKPGITKGNHWHHTKTEKFLVVKGTASIAFRHILTGEMQEYIVSGDKLEVVDIPVGYTHNIKNIGEDDLVTVMWANEAFNPAKPDTFFEEV